ncbi:hypothetical protein CL654_02375 [bacterium]|nr:hypothetical protein [bacterium]
MSIKTQLSETARFQVKEHWWLPRLLAPFHKVTVLNDPGPALGSEPRIIGSTHRSTLDHPFAVLTLVLASFKSIAPIRFVAKERFTWKELFWWPPFRQFYRWFYRRNMIIPKQHAIPGAVEALVEQKTSVLIYPEGKIWKGPGVGPLRKGIVAVHRQSGASIWLVALYRQKVSAFRWRVVMNWDIAPLVVPSGMSGEEGVEFIHARLSALYREAEAHGRS